jgi:hypothetical protein
MVKWGLHDEDITRKMPNIIQAEKNDDGVPRRRNVENMYNESVYYSQAQAQVTSHRCGNDTENHSSLSRLNVTVTKTYPYYPPDVWGYPGNNEGRTSCSRIL